MRPRRAGEGFALVAVLMVTTLLLLAGLSMWRSSQTDVTQIATTMARVQSQYVARGVLQLALLKAKLLPTPLYDATFYSVGKNPYYLHSRGYDHLRATPGPPVSELARVLPGPAFLTGDVDFPGGGVITRFGVKDIPGTADDQDADDLNPLDGLTAGRDFKVDRYLNFFALDLADGTTISLEMSGLPRGQVRGQASLTISTSTACPLLGGLDPFGGTFKILGMSVQGARSNRQYGEETLRIVAEAVVNTRISGEVRSWRTKEDTIFKVKRRS